MLKSEMEVKIKELEALIKTLQATKAPVTVTTTAATVVATPKATAVKVATTGILSKNLKGFTAPEAKTLFTRENKFMETTISAVVANKRRKFSFGKTTLQAGYKTLSSYISTKISNKKEAALLTQEIALRAVVSHNTL